MLQSCDLITGRVGRSPLACKNSLLMDETDALRAERVIRTHSDESTLISDQQTLSCLLSLNQKKQHRLWVRNGLESPGLRARGGILYRGELYVTKLLNLCFGIVSSLWFNLFSKLFRCQSTTRLYPKKNPAVYSADLWGK